MRKVKSVIDFTDGIIGQRIDEALAFRNVKQKELAKELGVKDNVVSYWCSGTRTPNTQQIVQISKQLNVSADYLLGVSEAKTNNIEIKAICDYTGLSENVIENLHNRKGKIKRILFCENMVICEGETK